LRGADRGIVKVRVIWTNSSAIRSIVFGAPLQHRRSQSNFVVPYSVQLSM